MMPTGITRWTPADVLRHRFDRLFDNTFGGYVDSGRGSEEVSSRAWMPAVDVRETEEGLRLDVELPGLSSEDVDITVENRVLTIRGERKFEVGVDRDSYHRIERAYGAFSRSFTLPTNVSADEVAASFADGVLTIAIPKAEEARPRKIAIS